MMRSERWLMLPLAEGGLKVSGREVAWSPWLT